MKKPLPLFVVFVLLVVNSSAQSSWLWGRQGISTGPGQTSALSMTIDAGNNAIIAGITSHDTINFGAFKLKDTSVHQVDAFIAKYDSKGNALWAHQSLGKSISYCAAQAYSVTADAFGNSFITGPFTDTISFGAFQLKSNNFQTMFLVKYDADGNVVWAKQTGMPPSRWSSCVGRSVTTDKTGNIYVTGTMSDTVSFGSVVLNSLGSSFYTVKYSPDGNVLWATQPVLNDLRLQNINATTIATDKYNNVYISGQFSDTITIGAYKLINPREDQNTFIAKYDSNGNVLWAKQFNTNPAYLYVNPSSISVDKNNAVYLTGWFSDVVSYGNLELVSGNAAPFEYNIFLLKMDSAGNGIWGMASGCSPNSACAGNVVTTDNQNHVYLSARGRYSNSTITQPDVIVFGGDTLTLADKNYDVNSTLYEMDTAGHILCSTILNGGGNENSVAVDPSGQYVYFQGNISAAQRLGPDSLVHTGSGSPFVARWNSCCAGNLIGGLITTPRDTICQGSKGNLILINTTGDSIQWQSSISGHNFANIPGAVDTTKYNTDPLAESTYYRAIVSNGGCTTLVDSIELIVPPPLTAAFTTANTGDNVTFSSVNSIGNIRNYFWDFGDGTTGSGASPAHTYAKDSIYYVCLTIYDGSNCSYTYCRNVDLRPNGVAHITAGNSGLIHPNPNNGSFTVSLNSLTSSLVTITIYDVTGHQIFAGKLNGENNGMDLSAKLAAGVYVFRISEGNNNVTGQKLIVIK